MKQESWEQARQAFRIESECIGKMEAYLDPESFGAAVRLLAQAERIATCGCGHSGIACMHFSHLLCCIERPSRFLSPAEAPHGATGFLQEGDVMVFASRGGKNRRASPDSGNLQEERGSCDYDHRKCRITVGTRRRGRSEAVRNTRNRQIQCAGNDVHNVFMCFVPCASGGADRGNGLPQRAVCPDSSRRRRRRAAKPRKNS